MDSMEDSGFDSDPKPLQNGSSESTNGAKPKVSDPSLKSFRKPDLQKKLERQREVARKGQNPVEQQPKGRGFLSRTRLMVPTKNEGSVTDPDQQPLVMLETDESEDEFAVPHLSKEAQREITQQLIKDGYNLDLEPDDEDLDLIPPRPINERCVCCQMPDNYCVIQ